MLSTPSGRFVILDLATKEALKGMPAEF